MNKGKLEKRAKKFVIKSDPHLKDLDKVGMADLQEVTLSQVYKLMADFAEQEIKPYKCIKL